MKMSTNLQHLNNLEGISELSNQELTKINGGIFPVVAAVIGGAAAAAYLYEFGYNMVDNAFARGKGK